MPGLIRLGDPDLDQNHVNGNVSTNVNAEGSLVAHLNSTVSGSGVTIITCSPDVFVNSIPNGVARAGVDIDQVTTLGPGALTVAANSETGAGAVVDNNMPVASDGTVPNPPANMQPSVDPTYIAKNVGPKYGKPLITNVESSYYEKDDQESSNNLPTGSTSLSKQESQQDPTGSPATGTPVHSCPDINSLADNFNWINEPPSTTWLASTYAISHMLTAYDDSFNAFQDWSMSFQLSANFTVYDLTMGTKVSRYKFTNTVNQNGSDNLTQKQTLINLCYHTNVILEVLLAAYPDMVITSGFRSLSSSSQHNKGQATDIQFLDLHGLSNTGQLYYNRAKDIRDQDNFDQVILEWFGKNPWLHISSNPAGHRHQVLTQVAPNSYQTGLVLLG